MEMSRVVMIRYTQTGPRLGSGLRIGGNLVLTADHVAAGIGYTVLTESGEKPASVLLRSPDPAVDLAIIEMEIPDAEGVPWLEYTRVDRETISTIEGCTAVGFPDFIVEKDDSRRSAHMRGSISTIEGKRARPGTGITPGYLSLKSTDQAVPAWPKIPRGDLEGTPWAGMSGAVVFSGSDRVVGVVRHHNPAQGGGTLALTPIDVIDFLPEPSRSEFWRALGVVDPQKLPVLPTHTEVSIQEKYSRAHRFLVAKVENVDKYHLADSLSVLGVNAGQGSNLNAQALASALLEVRDLSTVSKAVEALCPADPGLAVEIATRVFPFTWLDETHARWLRDIVTDPDKKQAAATRSKYQTTCDMLFHRARPESLDEKDWVRYPVGVAENDPAALLDKVRQVLRGDGGIPSDEEAYTDEALCRRMKRTPCVLYLPPAVYDDELLRPLRETFPDLTLFFWKLGPEDLEARGLDFVSCVQLPEKPTDDDVSDAVIELRRVGR